MHHLTVNIGNKQTNLDLDRVIEQEKVKLSKTNKKFQECYNEKNKMEGLNHMTILLCYIMSHDFDHEIIVFLFGYFQISDFQRNIERKSKGKNAGNFLEK